MQKPFGGLNTYLRSIIPMVNEQRQSLTVTSTVLGTLTKFDAFYPDPQTKSPHFAIVSPAKYTTTINSCNNAINILGAKCV